MITMMETTTTGAQRVATSAVNSVRVGGGIGVAGAGAKAGAATCGGKLVGLGPLDDPSADSSIRRRSGQASPTYAGCSMTQTPFARPNASSVIRTVPSWLINSMLRAETIARPNRRPSASTSAPRVSVADGSAPTARMPVRPWRTMNDNKGSFPSEHGGQRERPRRTSHPAPHKSCRLREAGLEPELDRVVGVSVPVRQHELHLCGLVRETRMNPDVHR